MKFLKPITLLLLICSCAPAFAQITKEEINSIAQSSDEGEIVMASSQMLQEGYLYYADILSDRLLEMRPESANYHYRKGYILLMMNRDYKAAIPHLEKAVANTDKNYDLYSAKEERASVDAFYYLGYAYHLDSEFAKARENMDKFIAQSRKKSDLLPEAQLRLKQIAVAERISKEPSHGYIKNLGEAVNSENPEYAPVISLDGSALYFTSRREWANNETEAYRDQRLNQFPEDIYVSYMDFDSSWVNATRLGFCKPERNEATIAVSTDERRLFLYQDNSGFGDIFFTDFYANKFQEIKPLEIDGVNSEYWETHCVVSPDGKLLFFVSERPDGYGGRDIYYMTKKADGTWTEAKNMGPVINTEYDEDAPFISFDNRTLYFASNGPTSMGGFDIFSSTIGSDNVWSTPQNLGLPYNSTNDDIFFTTTVDGTHGYLTSFRENGLGEKDIYEVKTDKIGVENVAVLKGKIKTKDGAPLPEDVAILVKLQCTDCEEDASAERRIYPRLKDGLFLTGLQPCKTYKLSYINATADNLMKLDSIKTDCSAEYREYYREYLLDVDRMAFVDDTVVSPINPPVAGSYSDPKMERDFGYNVNKASLNDPSVKTFLAQVDKQMAAGRQEITIEISASASKVPTTTYGDNQTLARLRADNMKKLIEDYFKSKNYSGKVTVVVSSVIVSGPDYAGDASNTEKYAPYQYVRLNTK